MTDTPMKPTIHARHIRQSLGISRNRMGRLLDVTARTLARIEDEERLPVHSAVASRLAKLQDLTDLGLVVYSPEGFARFMGTPLPAFGGDAALHIIERGEIERVLAEIAATYEGVPT